MSEKKLLFYFNALLVLLGITGASVIFLLALRYGIGVSPDSVAYISVARSISQGLGFIGYDGYAFVLQPPLYPLLLSAMQKIFFVDPLVSAGYINAILLGLIVYCSGLYLLKHLQSSALAIIGSMAILVSLIPIQIFFMALSEPLFILLIILYLYFFDLYRAKQDITSLLLLAVTVTLASLTRYVGVILIATSAICVYIWAGNILKGKLKHVFIFLFITVMPISFWIVRNFVLSGTLTGQRGGSSYTLPDNIVFTFNTFLKWYSFTQINRGQLFSIVLILTSGIFAVSLILLVWKKKNLRLEQTGPTLIFMMMYLGFIVISSTTTAYDKIDNRLLSPVFVPSVFIIMLALDNALQLITKKFQKAIITVMVLAGICFWMQYQYSKTTYYVNSYVQESGIQYNSKAWKNNSVINYLLEHKALVSGYSFYSNVPEAVYILANAECKWSPPKTQYNSPVKLDIATNNSFSYEKNRICLVWFSDINRKFLYTIEELQKFTKMEKVVRLKDGEIYIISK